MINSTRFRRLAIYGLLCFMVSAFALQAQTKSNLTTIGALRDFVQNFYSWYVPVARTDNANPAYESVIKTKIDILSPQLAQALQDDLDAQSKFPGEIVGIDFDPFLNTQDPLKRYVVGNVTEKDGSYRVEIQGSTLGKKHPKPDLIAEVTQKDGRWVFVNFYYPKNRDLISILKHLKAGRQTIQK